MPTKTASANPRELKDGDRFDMVRTNILEGMTSKELRAELNRAENMRYHVLHYADAILTILWARGEKDEYPCR